MEHRSQPGAASDSPQGLIRQVLSCSLLLLLSARLPEHLAALVMALASSVGSPSHPAVIALAMVGLDGFGVLCAVDLSHARLRGVPLMRCYPPQRLIPLSLHLLGLLWGALTLALQSSGGSGR